MKIELQFNQMVIDEQDLNSIVGSFMVPSVHLLPPHRKSSKRRRKTKNKVKASDVIDDLIDGIMEGKIERNKDAGIS